MATAIRYCNSDSGSDSNGGLSAGDSFLTIQAALTNLGAGNTDVAIVMLAGATAFTPASLTVPWTLGTASLEIRGTLGTETVNLQTTNSLFSSVLNYVALKNFVVTNCKSNGLNLSTYCKLDGLDISGGVPTNLVCTFSNSIICNSVFRNCGWYANTGVIIEDCEHYAVQVFSYLNGHGVHVRRCKFYNHSVSYNNTYGSSVSHCSFVGSSNAGKQLFGTRMINGAILNNVFASETTGFDPSTAQSTGIYRGNYYRAVSTPVANTSGIVDYTPPTELAGLPYADPSIGDWTLASELAAIVGSDGLTPGAVQSTGGGGTAGFTGLRGISKRLGT